jgi:hypothetical protein
LDVVAAPEGECQMWSGDYQPSRCENDADYLFVYQGSTNPEKDIRRNSLACEECFSPPDEYEGVDSGHGVATDGGVEQIADDRTFRDPDGRLLSVVIGGERLRFNGERSSTDHVEFERDHRDMGDLDPADRPRVVLSTHSMDPHWTCYFIPEGGSLTDRISLMKHERRTTDDELHLYGEGSPDVTIEYLERAESEEVATDGGSNPWDSWCDWCQHRFGEDGPEWMVETDVVTAWFCSEDCADQWDDDDEYTPERVDEQRVVADGVTVTVEDNHETPAPAEVDGVDLKHDGCPVCECMTFEEFPAGYYHCDDCGCVWAGDAEDASIAEYFGPSPEDLADADESLPVEIDGQCKACFVNPREDGSRHCSSCHEALVTDGYVARAEDHEGTPEVFDTLDAKDLRIKVGAHHDPADPIAAALDTDDDDGEQECALRLVDDHGPMGAYVALDDDWGLWALADHDDHTVEGPADRQNVRNALGQAETIHVVARDETPLTGEMRHPDIVTDGGTFDCGDCSDEAAADDVTALVQPDGEGAKLLCLDCQPNHPYDRQYDPADPAALLDEDGDGR